MMSNKLPQNLHLLSQFFESETQVQLSRVPLDQDLSEGCFRYHTGLPSPPDSLEGGSTSKLMHMIVGRIQFPWGCWIEGPISSVAISKSLSVPSHTSLSREQCIAWSLASLRGSEQECKSPRRKPQSFCNPISEVTTHHFSLYPIH